MKPGDRVRITGVTRPEVNDRASYVGKTGTIERVIKSRKVARVRLEDGSVWEASLENIAPVESANELDSFRLQASDDPVKTDLELVCTTCGERICDAEHGDSLAVLVETALHHRASKECRQL